MRHAIAVIAALLALLFASGCGNVSLDWGAQTPEDRVALAQESFVAVVNALTVLRERDVFTEGEEQQIGMMIHAAGQYLERCAAAIELDQPIDKPLAMLNEILREMVVARRDGARRSKKPLDPTALSALSGGAQ